MHIHTVCLQLKITELLHSSAVENNTLNKPLSVVGGGRGEGHDQPATLFSTGVVRGEVICNVSGRGHAINFSVTMYISVTCVDVVIL